MQRGGKYPDHPDWTADVCERCGASLGWLTETGRIGLFHDPCMSGGVVVADRDADNDPTQGRKFDGDKLRYDLVPWEPMNDVAAVLTHGAKKYAPENWKYVRGARWRYLAAAFRHLVARATGEKADPETGLPHTAHAICCLLFLGWFDKHEEVVD